jgi:two-component system phosphate regulon sensor histidine kinase PhoR
VPRLNLLLAELLACCLCAIAILAVFHSLITDSWLVLDTVSIVGLSVALLVLWRTHQHTRFLRELRDMLRQIQTGERKKRFSFRHARSAEDRSLALAFSEAHKSLHRRFQTVIDERSSEEIIIASMAEGVLGVDLQERIIRINPAASELLSVPADEALGRAMHEVVKSPELQRFVRSVLQERQPEETEIELHEAQERALQMSGRELLSADGERMGAIVVLSDITRLRKLERARSDFIANVSHELKTPVTSIQGFAETLLDGALDNPEDARRFLGIICRQAERLGQIFEEMLVLSRLEQEEQIELAAADLLPIIQTAAQSCERRAQSKNCAIDIECSSRLKALCHAPLLEQAISNLVENAVKYGPAGSKVQVVARENNSEISILVKDNGPGIEPQHLPRIFERFYRVDKGRSRSEGGTGLGLAIVKHIAQAHGGQATVESIPGSGSTFTIIIRRA